MGQEIERKFLVVGSGWREGSPGLSVRQGYLCLAPERTVRIRIQEDRGFLTIKGEAEGLTRPEFEYPIPLADARDLLGLVTGAIIEKTRYRTVHAGLIWDVDEFLGTNVPLVLAECELSTPDQRIVPPPWVGQEVTGDPRYFNSYLAQNPFGTW